MAVPTFFNVNPKVGPSRGKRVVHILGSNFQLPPSPPLSGLVPVPNPSVRVLFGDTPSDEVGVLTKGLLHVVTPSHVAGLVSITIQNIDQDGVLVPGETVTVANAYTFELPNLSTEHGAEASVLQYVVRTLVEELRKQVLSNVVVTTNVDFDDVPDAANIGALSELPGIVLSGPQLRENRLHTENSARDGEDETFLEKTEKQQGYTVDLVFTIIGVDESAYRHLNLMQETISFFRTNRKLRIYHPTDATKFVEFEMALEQPPSVVGGANNSNLRAFSGTVAVLGVTLDDKNMTARSIFEVLDVFPHASALPNLPGSFVEQFIPEEDD